MLDNLPAPASIDAPGVIESLRAGQLLNHDVFDADGVLLLSQGTLLTSDDLDRLHRRGQHASQSRRLPSSPSNDTPGVCRLLETLLSSPAQRDLKPHPQDAGPRRTLAMAAFREERAAAAQTHEQTLATFHEIAADICKGKAHSAESAEEMVGGLINMLSIDSDLVPTICSFRDNAEDYLFEHSVHVAMLAITIGDAVGLSQHQLRELGIGALLMDVGMLNISPELRMASRRLDPAERIEIERHTTITLDMLERIGGVTTAMMFVGYQCHERCDGSGYPNRRKKMLLHTYGRIGAIADAYTALTHERPHRSAYTPYEAVYQLLVDGAADKFDRQILRVMLDRLSLVPIGSYVTLSTGELAKVVRPNPAGMHTKPVVALIGADGRELDETIDLGHTPEITLDRAYGNEPPSHRIIQAP